MAVFKAVSVEVMRKSDAETIRTLIPSRELMRRAGEAIFEEGEWVSPVGIVCGKGNNAGDGFVVASLMKDKGIEVELILLFEDSFSEDGRYYYDICVEKGIKVIKHEDADYGKYGSILDCVFGTGFRGEVKGVAREAINAINTSGAYVVSADINSGLNGDTGEGELYVISDLTVSIGTFKYGHFTGRASGAMRKKVNRDIGIVIHGEVKVFEE